MVNVVSKRCSKDSCQRQPNFGFEGSTTVFYCRQHAEDGMVNVRKKRVPRGSGTIKPAFNVVGSKTPVYRKHHAEDAIVNVRTKRSLQDRDTTRPARVVPTNLGATTCAQVTLDILDSPTIISDSHRNVMGCQKVSRLELNRKQPPHSVNHGLLKEGGGEIVDTHGSEGVCRASFPRALQRSCNDTTIGTAANHTREDTAQDATSLQDECQSGRPIKTEMEVDVSM